MPLLWKCFDGCMRRGMGFIQQLEQARSSHVLNPDKHRTNHALACVTMRKVRAAIMAPSLIHGSVIDSKLSATSARYRPTSPNVHPLAPTTSRQGSSKIVLLKLAATPGGPTNPRISGLSHT